MHAPKCASLLITLNFEPSTSLAFRSSCSDMEAMKVKKRAHKGLTIEEKVEIPNQIGKKSYKLLSVQYGVWISTISGHRVYVTSSTQLKCISRACCNHLTCHRVIKTLINCILIKNTGTPPDLQKEAKEQVNIMIFIYFPNPKFSLTWTAQITHQAIQISEGLLYMYIYI